MEFQNLILNKEEGLLIITINRPEVRNALDRQTWQELKRAITQARTDPEVKVVIITGAGDKAFAAGADVKALKERSMIETLDGENQAILTELENLEKPVIAAINGYALGGGCELALACDIRIASENARLGQTELNLGFIPGAGGTQRLARLVGIGKAKELIFTGDIIDAATAERIGLVNRVVPLPELLPAAKAMAKKMMAKGPLALRMAKIVINGGISANLATGLLIEKLGQTVLFGTEDRMEGINAFLEKRDPQFQGR
ncbi:MAG: enoyl-CoA hydratase [Clostridia bacterium]|nr:enoyl-CoA hydratase [Clostridia bacterium]